MGEHFAGPACAQSGREPEGPPRREDAALGVLARRQLAFGAAATYRIDAARFARDRRHDGHACSLGDARVGTRFGDPAGDLVPEEERERLSTGYLTPVLIVTRADGQVEPYNAAVTVVQSLGLTALAARC